jgi:pyrimidine-nucleoside phosphorylase
MRMYDLIHAKKLGEALSEGEIQAWIKGVVAGTVPAEQSSALLMAICWRGMTTAETLALTLAMRDSGSRMDLSAIPGVKVDKHSTGGVGDKTTIALGPIVAACGVPVAMFSGRGLGHTGGTVDKFEAIPGMRVELSEAEFLESLRRTGFANSAQTPSLCPADRILYALRDVTATVESLPLITASIMSKKMAGGCEALVLDVKCGSSAFMKTLPEAQALARSMVEVGRAHGMRIKALVTRMEEPLGRCIGNALEVRECLELLQGRDWEGPLGRVTERLCAEMVLLGGAADSLQAAEDMVRAAVACGEAARRMKAFLALHGGDPRVVQEPDRLPAAAEVVEVRATAAGFVQSIQGLELGLLAMELGAGRRRQGDRIDPGVGLEVLAPVGTKVAIGSPLARLHLPRGVDAVIHSSRARACWTLASEPVATPDWLLDEME